MNPDEIYSITSTWIKSIDNLADWVNISEPNTIESIDDEKILRFEDGTQITGAQLKEIVGFAKDQLAEVFI